MHGEFVAVFSLLLL